MDALHRVVQILNVEQVPYHHVDVVRPDGARGPAAPAWLDQHTNRPARLDKMGHEGASNHSGCTCYQDHTVCPPARNYTTLPAGQAGFGCNLCPGVGLYRQIVVPRYNRATSRHSLDATCCAIGLPTSGSIHIDVEDNQWNANAWLSPAWEF